MNASDYFTLTSTVEFKKYYDMAELIDRFSKPSFKSFVEYCMSHKASVKRKK